MSSASPNDSIHTIRDLEEAVALLFRSNFDADSKVCLLTLMKVVDNILHKPGDPKVRKLRLTNATFQKKVACRPGGVELLLACGFVKEEAPPPLLSAPDASGETFLVLPEARERQDRLVTARRLFQTRAIQDLHMKPEELPEFRPPPRITATTTTTVASQAGGTTTFNPYVGHRYDAKSAAVGENLGPTQGYRSSTETQLAALQQKQKALEKSIQQPLQERNWQVVPPATAAIGIGTSSVASASTTRHTGGDGSLLAQHAKKQMEDRKQREEGGFTTSAMRELERMKRKKIYSHVQLTIQFPDGYKVSGKFMPKETLRQVQDVLRSDVLSTTEDLELYVTPPRRMLPLTSTLENEGLAPAAKVFLRWKTTTAPTDYLQSHILDSINPSTQASPQQQQFPTATPVAAVTNNNNNTQSAATSAQPAKKKRGTREQDMLKRMMGGR